MIASDFIAQCWHVLNDSGVTYTEPEMIGWINDGQTAIAGIKSDASSVIQNVVMTANSRQSIPAGSRRLLRLIRNMGMTGNTPGSSILGIVDMSDMDRFKPSWHQDVGPEVVNYMYDINVPNEFYIHPVAPVYIEGEFAVYPTDVVLNTDSISINNIYIPRLIEWVLFRAFSKDSPKSPNYARAQGYENSFYQGLGVKTQIDQVIDPNENSN